MNRMPVYTLLCHRDAGMAAMCLASFAARCKEPTDFFGVSDGSLTADDMALLRDQVPAMTILRREQVIARTAPALQAFPRCLKYREWCPWAMKLLDIPILAGRNYAYLDGDIFFFQDFTGLNPAGAAGIDLVSMHDHANVYSFAFWDRLAGGQMPLISRFNSGFMFVGAQAFNLEAVEEFLASAEAHKRPFLWEQTAWAALGARVNSAHFDPRQLAFPQTVLNNRREFKWRPVAVHFVGGTRHLIEPLQRAAASWQQPGAPIPLTITGSARLSRMGFAWDIWRHRMTKRRCRRYGVSQ